MKVYLVAGINSDSLKQVIEKDNCIQVIGCDNNLNNAFQNLIEKDVEFDVLLLLDQGIGDSIESFARILSDYKELFETFLPNTKLIFITKEPQYLEVFRTAALQDLHFESHMIDGVKIPVSLLQEICLGKSRTICESTIILSESANSEKKKLWRNFKKVNFPIEKGNIYEENRISNHISSTAGESCTFNPLSKSHGSISRIVAISGYRGSGISSTVSNLAYEASNQGLKTIIIDLDTLYRGINLYFKKFGDEVNLSPDMAFSLVRCMMKPDSYLDNTCLINDNLYVSTLAYSVQYNDKMLQHITIKRLIAMLGVLKSRFNLVLLDFPLDCLKQYPELVLHIDSIGLCTGNSLYSLINTVRFMGESSLGENLPVFKTKSKLILTSYNSRNTHQGRIINMDTVPGILSSLSSFFDIGIECAGIIPYCEDFDRQVESGKKICSVNVEYKKCYLNILNNII